MGVFIDAEKLKARSRIEEIREMDTEDIEDLLIRPAEAILESAFKLDLNTDADPSHWVGRFTTNPNLRTKFKADMLSSLIILCDRMESNPNDLKTQSVRGSSVTFGSKMPWEVKTLLSKWGYGGAKTGRVYR